MVHSNVSGETVADIEVLSDAVPTLTSMPDPSHVFVSYVREDSDAVDKLCRVMQAAQIPYWRDRTHLGPGDAWKSKIRDAIQSGALVFLPCFSENSRSKRTSYMNEELSLAVDEFRKMPPGRTWIIPVRFDDAPLPDWDLGANRHLSDYNYVDLFGDDYVVQAANLVATVGRLMGSSTDAAAVQAAVAQADDADRGDLLRRLTKEMLPDPSRRIELDDTIRQEGRRLLVALCDEARFPLVTSDSREQRVIALVEQATAIWHLVEPFCTSLQVATRWAEPAQLGPWTSGLQALGTDAKKLREGLVPLIELHYLPTLLTTMVVGLTGVGTDRWDNVKALIVDLTITERGNSYADSLIDVASPWSPFSNAKIVANILNRTAGTEDDPTTVLALYDNGKVPQFYTPESDWLHKILRPSFHDLFPDDENYSAQFDRAECMLGLISQDLANQRVVETGQTWQDRSRWFGRSTWRVNHSFNALTLITRDLARQQKGWPPLRAGLFGGDLARADAAVVAYTEAFDKVSAGRW